MIHVTPQTATLVSSHLFFSKLNKLYDLKTLRVLSPFSGYGYLTLGPLLSFVDYGQVEAWVYNEEERDAVIERVGTCKIGDAYDLLGQSIARQETFHLIDIDTPQGLHTSHGETKTEHFNFFQQAVRLIDRWGLVVVYVNLRPYRNSHAGFDHDTWLHNREAFYGAAYPTFSAVFKAYETALQSTCLTIQNIVAMPCFSDVEGMPVNAMRVAFELQCHG